MRRWAGKRIQSSPLRVDRVPTDPGKNHPKRQHYYPQSLLRRFAISGTDKVPKIHFFDKVLGREDVITIHGAASERRFNDFTENGEIFTLEYGFNEFEGTVNQVIESIVSARSIGHLSQQDRVTIADYLIKQLVRTRQARNEAKSMLLALEKAIPEKFGFTLQESFPDYEAPTEESVSRIARDQLREGTISPELLLEKGWILLETNEQDPFYTSDNPVGRSNYRAQQERWPRGSRGLRSPYVEVYFPLSPTLCLYLVSTEHIKEIQQGYRTICALEMAHPERAFGLWEAKLLSGSILEDLKVGRASRAIPDVVKYINSVQCNGCTRHVYSAFPGFPLAKEMKADGCFKEDRDGDWVFMGQEDLSLSLREDSMTSSGPEPSPSHGNEDSSSCSPEK